MFIVASLHHRTGRSVDGWTTMYKWGHPVATLPATNGTHATQASLFFNVRNLSQSERYRERAATLQLVPGADTAENESHARCCGVLVGRIVDAKNCCCCEGTIYGMKEKKAKMRNSGIACPDKSGERANRNTSIL
eukprot:6205302-Pleurochrysis_carterae.AAC.1